MIDATVWDGDRLLIRLDHLAIERWLSEPVGDGELPQRQPLALPLPDSDQAQGALLVDVDGDRFALPASWVRHIAEDRVPVPLARVHQTIAGLLSWERTPLPVIDVVRGSGRVSTARMLLVVVGHPPGPSTPPSHPVAVLRVSGVSDVVAVAEWSRESAKLADGRRIPLLDIDRALAVD
jgi:chemotaxis signal transduction protein